jgi:pyruvate formate lyase activating enzyme
MLGNIIDIKKFTVHDGPGIRSTVFLKGCPLSCLWCHNPEGIENKINLWYFEKKCIKCNQCISACRNTALSIGEENQSYICIDHNRCSNMGNCVNVCPTAALCFDGREISSEEIINILLEDRIFYEQSGGGITVSGGEPTYQHAFSLEILKRCKDQKIHTAIETCMYAKKAILERFIPYTDLFLVDIKLFDSEEHKKYTGVANEQILSNFRFLAEKNVSMQVRIPLISGITTTEENIRSISSFVFSINKGIPIELMNYNSLAENKYRLMGKDYSAIKDLKPLPEKNLHSLYRIIEEEGITVIRETKTK